MKNTLSVLVLFIILIFLFACEKTELLTSADQISKINMQIEGLNALGDSAWYEGWIVWTEGEGDNVTNVFESIGLLTSNGSGVYTKAVDVNLGYIQRMLHLLITIEQDMVPGYKVTVSQTSVDSVPGPSAYRVIAAKLAANRGDFKVGNDLVLDFDFTTAQATYILDTPTDSLNTNLKRGIWFLNLDTTFTDVKDTSGTVIAVDTTVEQIQGLDLPELPNDWLYEGWIINGTDTLSTGTFKEPYGADDSSKYGAGAGNGYNFPGEDFINNAPPGVTFPAELCGKEVVISIKPKHPENSNCPFMLIPFSTTIPVNCEAKKIYLMENRSISFPRGSVTVSVSVYDNK